MAKIVLEVDEKNLGSIVTILSSLKDGLITDMEVSSSSKVEQKKVTRYQPKKDKVIYENEQEELSKNGKYLKPSEFKKRFR